MPSRSKTIKVSDEEYAMIQLARKTVMAKGMDRSGISEKETEEQDLDLSDIALGAIVSVGAYLLYKSLMEK